ncbi:alpha/beta hydrolase, partial [Streptomyces sp. NPDC059853]
MRRAVGVLAGMCLLAAGCTAAPGDGDAPIPGVGNPSAAPPAAPGPELPAALTRQQVDWDVCGAPTPEQGAGEAPGAEWECGRLTVPLDYARPDGETLSLALIRIRAEPGAGRIGSLVFNFGGPGGSGVATLPRVARTYEPLRQGFDLVAFDPRGVGASSPVVCRDGAALDAAAQEDPGVPRTRAEGEERA